MAAAENAHQYLLNNLILSDDYFTDLIKKLLVRAL
jgi:hypothetical protein